MSKLLFRGFSTIEIMIALMIMGTTLAAVVLITIGIPSALSDGHAQEVGASEASALLQKEFLLGLNSFSSVTSLATTTISDSNTTYTISLSVSLLPDGLTKQLTSIASWTDAKGRPESVSISGIVTDFKDALANSCSNVLGGNWKHPTVMTFSFPSRPLQVLITATSTLFATVTDAINPTDSTLFIFDISSSTHPAYLGSMDNANSTRSGFAALATNNNLVFGASAYGADFGSCAKGPACSQLQIIDANNPANPTLIENFELSTTSTPFATGSGGQSAGKSIFYANGLIYLGLQKTSSATGDEFNIINVQNPQAPIWLGGYSIGRTVNHIQVLNGYAYLATDDPTRELVILDVRDPAHITLAGSYNAPGNTTFGFGEALSVASTTLILGRSYIQNESPFLLLDVSSPATPELLGFEATSTLINSASIESTILRNFLAFVLTGSSLESWDVSNPAQPISYATPIMLPGTGSITSTSGLTCRNNTLYVASTDSANTGYLTAITGS